MSNKSDKRDYKLSEILKYCKNENFIYSFLYKLGAGVAKFCIKVGMTPNAVTITDLILGVAGGILFAFPDFRLTVLGSVLIFISMVLDCTDGLVARVTHNFSDAGRFLDGVADILVYSSMYLSVTYRLTECSIPFTQSVWGPIIWPVSILTGLFAARQARDVDYAHNLHEFLCGEEDSVDGTKSILKKASGKIRLSDRIYLIYTGMQEKAFPESRAFLDKIENGTVMLSKEYSASFSSKYMKYLKLGSLVYPLRTFSVVIFSLLNIPLLSLVFILTVIELIRIIVVHEYEKEASLMNHHQTE